MGSSCYPSSIHTAPPAGIPALAVPICDSWCTHMRTPAVTTPSTVIAVALYSVDHRAVIYIHRCTVELCICGCKLQLYRSTGYRATAIMVEGVVTADWKMGIACACCLPVANAAYFD